MNEIEDELICKITGEGTAAKLQQHLFGSAVIIQKVEPG